MSSEKVSRRQFVKGAAASAVAVTSASMLGSAAQAATVAQEAKPWLPESWDYEADVVVVGTGFAAQTSAIEAHKAGAEVLMLEKAPEELQGGNSRVCGQGFIAPPQEIWEDYVTYITALTSGLGFPIDPDPKVSEETIRFYIEESSKSIKWFEDMGATVITREEETGGKVGEWIPFYPHMPGADALAKHPASYRVGGDYSGAGGNWYFLEDKISELGIKKLYETPVKALIQDPVTKEVLGVVAESGGKDIHVKARKAVCVCAGGWEYNQEMVKNFQWLYANYSVGTPFNTGETIKMCWAAGADLRNMAVNTSPALASVGPKPPYKSSFSIVWPMDGGYITVGANNKRWKDEHKLGYAGAVRGIANKEKAGQEGATTGVGTEVENGTYIKEKFPMPAFFIFDEKARLSGSLFSGAFATQVEGYRPSPDNSAELEAGWFVKADTIEELAEKIGRGNPDPLFGQVPLKETIDRWNEMCAAGQDTDWGRTKNLNPIAEPPFYAVEIFQGCINTQGGMKRNTKAQVLDIYGKPIPRLYAAGENGDIWTVTYQCMSNVGGGCYGYGRVAGQNAAAEEPWA